MKLTPLIQKAINESARLHGSIGQMRKLGNLPYIVHPFSVGWLLAEAGADEEVIAAGMLHDVLEDVLGPSGTEYLKKEFGNRVAQIVVDVSEKKDPTADKAEQAPWLERKQGYLAHLAEANEDALLVSLADKIHNLESLVVSYQKDGPSVLSPFNSPKGELLWFYEKVAELGRVKMPKHVLVSHLEETVKVARGLFE